MGKNDEIEDIMSEIKTLQKGLAEAAVPKPAPVAAAPSTPRFESVAASVAAPTPEPKLEPVPEVVAEPVAEPVVEPQLAVSEESMNPEQMMTDEASEGALSMTVNGSMTLKLRYEYAGQEVTIRFADQALHVELSDGTEFKIPVGRALAKAA